MGLIPGLSALAYGVVVVVGSLVTAGFSGDDTVRISQNRHPENRLRAGKSVVTFLAPSTRAEVLRRLAAHLAEGGRAVIGFGTDRGYAVADFESDVAAAGMAVQGRYGTWELHPFDSGDFLVAVLEKVS